MSDIKKKKNLHVHSSLTFGEVDLERVDVLVEAQRAHGPKQVLAVDGLALLLLALVAGLGGDEADELRHALLACSRRQQRVYTQGG